MGASKGIGRGVAASLSAEGARVAIASRSRENVDRAAAELAGDRARGFVADAANLDALPDLVRDVEAALGPIEILVTNTGGPPVGDPLGFERSQWMEAYRSLVLAPMALIS